MTPVLSSLPPLSSLAEATSYDLTFHSYLTVLAQYPRSVLLALESHDPLGALGSLYVETNPLVTNAAFALALMPLFFFVSEFSRNYSQVDRVWGILPLTFAAHYAVWNWAAKGPGDPIGRVSLAAVLLVLWGARLTFNYWRKGGYHPGVEDYRWKIIRKNLGTVGSTLMNFSFASTCQFVLQGLTFPMYILLLSESVAGLSLRLVDVVFGAAILLFIVIAGIADQQQWDYQNAKQTYEATGKVSDGFSTIELQRGFLTRGLWSYSRHPNFTCEQAVWVALYLWSCVITQTWYNWSVVGALCYLIMFQGSTRFSESISAGKYAQFGQYQRSVCMLLPMPGYGWSAVPTREDARNQRKQIKKDL